MPGQMKDEMDHPCVSIFMITYKHEKYIAQAIESVINQITTFKIKLFIGDDSSPDNTKNICLEYAEKYPEIITVMSTKTNNIRENVSNVWQACFSSKARYLAICDGDDYWTDKYKLQKQVDFLEKNPDYTLVFSDAEIVYESAEFTDSFMILEKDVFSIEDIILSPGFIMPAPSMLFRNVLTYPFFPDSINVAAFCGDFAIALLLLDKGKAKYIKEKLAAYRQHGGGISKSKEFLEKKERMMQETLEYLNKYFKYKYDLIFKKRYLNTAKYNLISGSVNKKGVEKIKHYFKTFPEYIKRSEKINMKEIIYYHTILFFPKLLKLKK